MGLIKEFKEFAVKGSVVDMAVGIMIGAAFATVVTSFSTDVLMPPIGILLGDDDLADKHWVLREGPTPGPYTDPAAAKAAGAVTLDYGSFINASIAFLITAAVLFLIVRAVNRMRRRDEDPDAPSEPTRKTCPWCATGIPVAARRCPQCTSSLE